MRRCREQIAVRVNWPWAWFDKALFDLCLNDVQAAQATYHEVLTGDREPQEWMVNTHLRSLKDLHALDLDGYDAVIDYLRPYASKEKLRELGFDS